MMDLDDAMMDEPSRRLFWRRHGEWLREMAYKALCGKFSANAMTPDQALSYGLGLAVGYFQQAADSYKLGHECDQMDRMLNMKAQVQEWEAQADDED